MHNARRLQFGITIFAVHICQRGATSKRLSKLIAVVCLSVHAVNAAPIPAHGHANAHLPLPHLPLYCVRVCVCERGPGAGFGEFEFGACPWEIRSAPSLFVHVWRCSRVFNLINFVKFKANTNRSALCQKIPSFRLPVCSSSVSPAAFYLFVRVLGRAKLGTLHSVLARQPRCSHKVVFPH